MILKSSEGNFWKYAALVYVGSYFATIIMVTNADKDADIENRIELTAKIFFIRGMVWGSLTVGCAFFLF